MATSLYVPAEIVEGQDGERERAPRTVPGVILSYISALPTRVNVVSPEVKGKIGPQIATSIDPCYADD